MIAAPVNSSDVVERALAGETLACARLMTWAERGDPRYAEQYPRLVPQLGRARRIGLTGPPGAGKSTLVERLILRWRRDDLRVGVIAVDPSSPFSGGALLGDRVRMGRAALDKGVFIRSMATRGLFGGLARATDDAADVLDAYGVDRLLLETVGVGQSEVDVAASADMTVVVLHPGGGDTIQAMKAGLMEVADLYVVNKADLPGADKMASELADMLLMRSDAAAPTDVPILMASATDDTGTDAVCEAIDAWWASAEAAGRIATRRRENLVRRVRRLVEARIRRDLWHDTGLGDELARWVDDPAAPLGAHGLADAVLDAWVARGRHNEHPCEEGEP